MTLYEDKDVIVLNKPYGLAVQGGSGTKRHIDGMLEALAEEGRDAAGAGPPARPRHVRRAAARQVAQDGGRARRDLPLAQAKKIYWALVEGVPKPAQGRISMFLAKGEGMGDERGAKGQGRADLERMRVAKHGDPDAQHSLTLYAVVDKVAPRLAWLSMRPITGRTHQLRAHCEAIGHPIVGDPKYNRRPDNDPARNDPLRAVPPGIEPKLHLLARRLILPHPRGGVIDVTAPLPRAHEERPSTCSASSRPRATRSRTRPMRDGEAVDPMRAAQANMRPPPVKRFYKTVEVRDEADGGYALTLDGRGARTPGKNRSRRRAARSMRHGRGMGAAGRDARPLGHAGDAARSIPRSTASRTRMDETRAEIVRYAGSDLLCYRAEEPEALAERQRAGLRSGARLGGRGARRALRPGGRRDRTSRSRAETIGGGSRRDRRVSTIRSRSRR